MIRTYNCSCTQHHWVISDVLTEVCRKQLRVTSDLVIEVCSKQLMNLFAWLLWLCLLADARTSGNSGTASGPSKSCTICPKGSLPFQVVEENQEQPADEGSGGKCLLKPGWQSAIDPPVVTLTAADADDDDVYEYVMCMNMHEGEDSEWASCAVSRWWVDGGQSQVHSSHSPSSRDLLSVWARLLRHQHHLLCRSHPLISIVVFLVVFAAVPCGSRGLSMWVSV